MAEVLIDDGAKEAFLGKPIHDMETDIEFYIGAGYDYISLGRHIAGFPGVWDAAKSGNYYGAQCARGKGSMKGLISDWADFRAYPWMPPEDLDFGILDRAEKLLPREMKVLRYVGPVFQMAWLLMGFEQFSYKLADDPGFVRAIMDRVSRLVEREVEDAVGRDVVGAVWYVDDIAIKDRLMVAPEFLRETLFPRIRAIAERCRARGIPLIYHTDGNIVEVLSDIMDAGVSALHPIDPTGMDIYRFKPDVAGRLCLMGNIDIDLLEHGTPEQVAAETRKHIEFLAPGGGYVVGSSNSVVSTSRPENYRAMLETTLVHGAYPIQASG